jgi:hypothetical protein
VVYAADSDFRIGVTWDGSEEGLASAWVIWIDLGERVASILSISDECPLKGSDLV